MRLLEYRQTLFGNGYTVSSDTRHYEERCERECLPIKMYRLDTHNKPCNHFADLAENALEFNWDASVGTKEEFHIRYTNLLCGNLADWQIIAFQVTADSICLDFYNSVTEQTDFCRLRGTNCGFTLRFEVPHYRLDCEHVSIYEVYLTNRSSDGHGTAQVIESFNHIRREIEFFSDVENRNEQYVEVTEYADL